MATNPAGRPAKFTQHIHADKEGFLEFLAERRDEHKAMAESQTTQREKARESGIAQGLELAMHFVQSWEEMG